MNKSEQINELATALSKFQTSVKQPLKDKANPFFRSKYVPLENVAESVMSAGGPLGLSYVQFAVNEDNRVGVGTMIMHTSGQFIEFEPIFATPAKNDPQGVGSAITYLKRYSLSAAFGITSEDDDDGNSNNNKTQPPKQQQKPIQQTKSAPTGKLNMPKDATEARNMILPEMFKAHVGKTLQKVWETDQNYIKTMASHSATPVELVEGILLIQQDIAMKAAKEKQGE